MKITVRYIHDFRVQDEITMPGAHIKVASIEAASGLYKIYKKHGEGQHLYLYAMDYKVLNQLNRALAVYSARPRKASK